MKCKICGAEETPGIFSNEKELEEHQMCFKCNFWREMLEEDKYRPDHTVCMINGTHYVIGSESNSVFRGFGGAKFEIQFNDGTRITTTNLWCQGNPSKEWIDKFPNNAKFVDNLIWVNINGTKYLV